MISNPGDQTAVMHEPPRLNPLARALRAYLRSPMRGKTRLIFLLGRFKSLHSVPITFDGGARVYVDLRLDASAEWLQGTPWSKCPREPAEQLAMERVVREASIAFDIGANLGLHTMLLSHLVGAGGKVFAFEPNPELRTNLALTVAGLQNAELMPIALAECRSTETLFVPEDHSMASLADWTSGRLPTGTRRLDCEVHCMDDLIASGKLPPPDFIKCDVEGAELKVFKGARRTLDRVNAPVILFEENLHTSKGFGLTPSAARVFLKGLSLPNYRFFEVTELDGLVPSDEPNPLAANILAVPESKLLLL